MTEVAANPFSVANAKLYHQARPRYQGQALVAAAQILRIDSAVDLAVDIGCGTGHSSVALAVWANHVVALDPAMLMLEAAEAAHHVRYVAAAAQCLPIQPGTVDMLTAGAVFHWLDGAKFLEEAHRVLRPHGALVTYSDFFTGKVREAAQVESWIHGKYVPAHPSPPRRPHLTAEMASASGFEVVGTAELQVDFVMSVEAFADYLLTQSNAVAFVLSGKGTEGSLRSDIVDAVRPMFPESNTATAVFGARVLCCRRPA